MSETTFHHTVQIFDTDCYGVMWHGAYLRWLEMARVHWCEAYGVPMASPDQLQAGTGYLYPVIDIQLKYRAPARLHDTLTFVTQVTRDGARLRFHQTVSAVATSVESAPVSRVTLEAVVTVAVVDAQWRPLRHLPDALREATTPTADEVSLALSSSSRTAIHQ